MGYLKASCKAVFFTIVSGVALIGILGFGLSDLGIGTKEEPKDAEIKQESKDTDFDDEDKADLKDIGGSTILGIGAGIAAGGDPTSAMKGGAVAGGGMATKKGMDRAIDAKSEEEQEGMKSSTGERETEASTETKEK